MLYPTYHYLLSHLGKKLKIVDRVVITGDLMETPSDENANLFLAFSSSLEVICEKEPILIPENHDHRWRGLLEDSYPPMSRLFGNLPRPEIDEDLEILFFCFDSSKDSTSSWGIIPNQQLRDIERKYSNECNRKTSLADYLFIGLLHLHPFSFTEGASSPVQKGWNYIEEKLLHLKDAETFHMWCAEKKICLLLHRHKHIPRRIHKTITYKDELIGELENLIIEAIGCGTSLGAEKCPMSYNVLIWNPSSQLWAITFWQQSETGAFKRRLVKVEKNKVNEF